MSKYAVLMPDGELSPIPDEVSERYGVKEGQVTPFTNLPIVSVEENNDSKP